MSQPPAEPTVEGATDFDVGARTDELVAFALQRLPAMLLADGSFCHEVVAAGERASGGRLGRGERVRNEHGEPQALGRSLRYTLMVLIGGLRARAAGVEVPFDLDPSKRVVLDGLDAPELTLGDLGLVLWADARSGLEAPGEALRRLDRRLAAGGLDAIESHELGWVATGCAAALAAGCADPGAERILEATAARLLERADTPSGLLAQADRSARARFPHFATQIYAVLALATVAQAREHQPALAAARRTADRLLELQLDDGAWPWIYDVRKGSVVEPYRLYSVHQDAMAPMALRALSEASGDERYEAAAVRGLPWVWGANELGRPMLDHQAGMLHRSINRRGWRDRTLLWANTLGAYVGHPPRPGQGGAVEVERTDRPYHLGWVLEAWGDRVGRGGP